MLEYYLTKLLKISVSVTTIFTNFAIMNRSHQNTLHINTEIVTKFSTLCIKALPLMIMFSFLLCLSITFNTLLPEPPVRTFIKCAVRSGAPIILLALASLRHRWLRILSTIILSIVLFYDFFCLMHLDCRINAQVIFLMLQTNNREVGEFFSDYIFNIATLKALLYTLIVPVAGLLCNKYWNRFADRYFYRKRLCRPASIAIYLLVASMFMLSILNTFVAATRIPLWICISFICSAISLPILPIFRNRTLRIAAYTILWMLIICTFYPPMILSQDLYLKDKKQNSIQNVIYSLVFNLNNSLDIDRLTEVNRNIKLGKVEKKPFKLVLIIGESYNRLHTPLYGYDKPTTPHLEQEVATGNLTVFSDVVTPTEATAYAMPGLLTTHPYVTDNHGWEEYPLFPAILRKVGYTVSLVDNHATMTADSSSQFASAGFYSSAEMSHLCFDTRNENLVKYDEISLERYMNEAIKADVCIVHPMGQHSQAVMRYPAEWNKWSAKDYGSRTELDRAARQKVAEYDNATLYNDYIIYSILNYFRDQDVIAIYLTDHGEVIYDDGLGYGRSQGAKTKEYMNSVYHIPFMIWCSDSFRERHADIVARVIAAKDKPVLSFDLSQIILDILEIDSPWTIPDRSVLSPTYRPRRRVLQTGEPYIP